MSTAELIDGGTTSHDCDPSRQRCPAWVEAAEEAKVVPDQLHIDPLDHVLQFEAHFAASNHAAYRRSHQARRLIEEHLPGGGVTTKTGFEVDTQGVVLGGAVLRRSCREIQSEKADF